MPIVLIDQGGSSRSRPFSWVAQASSLLSESAAGRLRHGTFAVDVQIHSRDHRGMPRVVALLRGINVGGHRVKMEDLRGHFEALKLKNVTTFIASGNVLFDTSETDLAALEQRIEKHLGKKLGFEAATFIRTLAELEAAVAALPFPKIVPTDSIYVFFFRSPVEEAEKKALLALESKFDQFSVRGRECYWLCHGKISEVSLAWPKLEKLARSKTAVAGTSRNITSLRKMLGMAGG